MQNSGELLETTIPWLQADRENSIDILKNKNSSIIQINQFLSSEVERIRNSIKGTENSLKKTRTKIKQMRKEKKRAERVKSQMIEKHYESPAFKSLSQQRERVEEHIVHFKLLMANVKSEIEEFEDFKFQLNSEITHKNSRIQQLIEDSYKLKNERHQLVVKQATRSISGHVSSISHSFAKFNIKQVPSSSFQMRFSVDELDSGVNSTPSNWVSSRHSEV